MKEEAMLRRGGGGAMEVGKVGLRRIRMKDSYIWAIRMNPSYGFTIRIFLKMGNFGKMGVPKERWVCKVVLSKRSNM